MKRLLSFLIIACAAVGASAQTTDTIASLREAQAVTIENGSDQTAVTLQGRPGQPGYRYVYIMSEQSAGTDLWDTNVPFLDAKKSARRHTRVLPMRGISVGTIMPVGDSSPAMKAGWEVGVQEAISIEYSPRANGAALRLGVGVMWHTLGLDDGMRFDKTDGALSVFPAAEGADLKSSRIYWTSFTVPVMWQQPLCKRFGLTLGAVLNFNTYAIASTTYMDGDTKVTEHYKGLQQRPVTVDVVAGLGILDYVGVYVRYSPMNLMREGYGPHVNTLSAGLSLHF